MSNLKNKIFGYILYLAPIPLFWFIPWYWLIIYYNILLAYASHKLYQELYISKNNKAKYSLFYYIIFPLIFNFFGFMAVVFMHSSNEGRISGERYWVNTNKELRDKLNNLCVYDDNIQSIEVKLNLKKWSTYESNVNVTDLSYHGYKYELIGHIKEKRSDAELHEEIESLNTFFQIIEDKEIDVLDSKFEYYKNGESDYHYIDKVKWIDHAPEHILKEFDQKYKKGEYHQYDQLIEHGEIDHVGESLFVNELNNIDQIQLKLKVFDDEDGLDNLEIFWKNPKR